MLGKELRVVEAVRGYWDFEKHEKGCLGISGIFCTRAWFRLVWAHFPEE